jgi:DNA-binding response OmpR family regulator
MPTVLVADDDVNIRKLGCFFLHNDEFATIDIINGKEAMDIYSFTPVDPLEFMAIHYTGDDRTIDVNIKRLRERFTAISYFRIQTVRGLGYRLEVYQ